jgi:hypothetical protein
MIWTLYIDFMVKPNIDHTGSKTVSQIIVCKKSRYYEKLTFLCEFHQNPLSGFCVQVQSNIDHQEPITLPKVIQVENQHTM